MSRHASIFACCFCGARAQSAFAAYPSTSARVSAPAVPAVLHRSFSNLGRLKRRTSSTGSFRIVEPKGSARELIPAKLSKENDQDLLEDATEHDVLALLRRGAAELSGRRNGKTVEIFAAFAKRLGLDENEVRGLTKLWADRKPFSLEGEGKGKGKGKATEALMEKYASAPMALQFFLISLGLMRRLDIAAVQRNLKLHGSRAIVRAILSHFLCWLRSQVVEDFVVSPQLASIIEALDLRYPAEWYPSARSLRRKLILHVGPTNSGKTYNALCALAKARTGAFAGPLRLLATEVYNRFHAGTIGGLTPGTPRVCNLVTGEERRIHDEMAGLESCTVEMLSLTKHYDVVVIDEIQMMGDPRRGAGWTNALLGVRANEIHLCGEASVVDLVKRLGKACGDEVILNTYERLSPLVVASNSLEGDFKTVKRGDCVVTFSRNNIFAVKKEIEQKTGLRVAVAYGGLPPEVREEQAKGFNAAGTPGGYDVMVASDAIGMGLNLLAFLLQ